MPKVGSLLLAGFSLLVMLPTARADITAITLNSASVIWDDHWTIGFEFSPTTDIFVTSLGSFFPNYATDPHGVTLWDASQNVLASAVVTGTGTGGFDFAAITPYELLAGTDYIIGANTDNDAFAQIPGLSYTVAPDIDLLEAREAVCYNSAPCYPSTAGPPLRSTSASGRTSHIPQSPFPSHPR